MSDDHIAVKIDGVIYVKLDDVKPMRARIEQLEAALREIEQRHIPDCPSSFWGEPVDWVERQFSDLRRIARAALGEKKDE